MGFHCMKQKLGFTPRLSPTLKKIKKDLKNKHFQTIKETELDINEQEVIAYIKKETTKKNINNIVRTRSYLDFYIQLPEIHWAFLAHMVSRNGGWNMTDLKGDLLSKLLSVNEQNNFFAFLERSNWLIFQDAYPQLLLYQESVNRNTNLFHLLPHFGVSQFMQVVWNHYSRNNRDNSLLTNALIINEQNYLEDRVMQNAHYQNSVLDTIEFNLQELLSLNQILFPYQAGGEIKIIGQTVHHFSFLHDRILLGKRLYSLLFDPKNLSKFFKWALQKSHTGSRKDYWPELFNDINEAIPGQPFKRRTKNCQLKPGANRIYSPRLDSVWDNKEHEQAEHGDWYCDWTILDYLQQDNPTIYGDIFDEYCNTLEKIELAIITKEAFSK